MVGGVCVAGETATAADGTHPTGMLSYSYYFRHASQEECSSTSLVPTSSVRCWSGSVTRSHPGLFPL